MEGSYIANVQVPGQQAKKSVITFNQGGAWAPLSPPAKNTCDNCSLHLIGFIDSMGTSIHSEPNDKGIIMALGNVGKFLNTNDINTYISTDGVTIYLHSIYLFMAYISTLIYVDMW